MTLMLRVSDARKHPPAEYDESLPFPGVGVSVRTVAKIAVKRAREHGLAGALERVEVFLGERRILPTDANATTVPDASRMLVIIRNPLDPCDPADVWMID